MVNWILIVFWVISLIGLLLSTLLLGKANDRVEKWTFPPSDEEYYSCAALLWISMMGMALCGGYFLLGIMYVIYLFIV